MDTDLYHWTKALRPVQVPIIEILRIEGSYVVFNAIPMCLFGSCLIGQWYPGHIAKTEKELKTQLKLMDVVIEVRDARIPLSTSHPQVRDFCD